MSAVERQERLKVIAQKEKQKRQTDNELCKKRNSLIISPLFFDEFTGELISLITYVNYKFSPPLRWQGIIWFFFTSSHHQVMCAELYFFHENFLIISCQHSWSYVHFGRPPTDVSVGRRAGREKQANWLSLQYLTELRAWWTDSSLFIRGIILCSDWSPV